MFLRDKQTFVVVVPASGSGGLGQGLEDISLHLPLPDDVDEEGVDPEVGGLEEVEEGDRLQLLHLQAPGLLGLEVPLLQPLPLIRHVLKIPCLLNKPGTRG